MNIITLIGRVGSVEVRSTQNSKVANISLATTENRKVGETWEKETTWHNLVVFGKRAEVIEKYVSKGDFFACTGSLRIDKWEDKEGVNRTKPVIYVKDFDLISSKKEDNSNVPY